MQGILKWGIGVVLWLQQFSPALDGIFKAFTYAGEEDFFFLLLPIVAWCIDRRAGLRLAIVFLLSSYIGTIIKELTNQPRPYQFDSRVQMLFETTGKAFPSLHTQNTTVIWGFLASQARKTWVWIIAGVLFVGVPLSRVYLGLHFPTDLLGGYIFGIVILLLFLRIEQPIELKFHQLPTGWKLVIAILIPLLLFLSFPSTDETVSSATGVVFGAWTGIILERLWVRFSTAGALWKRVGRFLVGIAGVMVLRVGLKALFGDFQPESLFRFIRYGAIGIWFTLGAPWLFVKLSLAEKEPST
ncbi:MAG: phosphatase PAP2 family protein [Anaerolineales bacterium]|nr:MAG: phosphatase PAP2 family protein [Anaerolineales bacterium]